MNTEPQRPRHTTRDDGLEWLREIRRQISAEFGHDQKRIGDYLRQREKEYGDRVVRTQKRVVRTQKRVVPAKP